MKYLFKILLILFFSFSNNLIAATEEVDEERYTSGGQWEVLKDNLLLLEEITSKYLN